MGKWEKVRLGDVCIINMGQSPDSASYNTKGDGLPFYQGNADFGELHPIVRYYCNAPTKTANPGDLLLSVRAPIGALNIAIEKCCIGRGLCAITPKKCLAQKYLYYVLKRKNIELNSKGTGSTFKAINKQSLSDTYFSIPPIEEQRKIAATLDAVADLLKMRKQQLTELDKLVKSQFIEMFGDPVTNPKRWEVKPLGVSGTLKNGMNYSQYESGYLVHCLGVGDFGYLYKIDDARDISKISLSAKPSKDYLLQRGDIVFVRSNGNKALVGRSVEVLTNGEELTFSGFCIRYRNENPGLLTVYLNHALHMPSLRLALLSDGRGANIQNLNQQMLAALKIPIPPLPLQNRFADFVRQVDQTKSAIQQSIHETQALFDSLMSEYFE